VRTSLAPAARSFVWPTLATIVFVALCVTAGNWQRARMHEKEALAAALAQADRTAAVPLQTVAGDWPALRYRHVVASGRFDAADQFLVDNRVHDGRVGFDVVTPLALADGAFVLVDRGFVAVGRDRRVLPDAPPPPGDVTVEGRVELPVTGFLVGNPPPQGVLWPHLDPSRYAERSGRRVLPVYLQATSDVGAGLARDWPAPDLGTERHLSYMVQWFTFAAMAAGLWAYFAWRRWRTR
jgi:surfeit locus 1 family protein